jgi:gluconokinase
MNVPTPLILTLDLGSSSTRALLFDAQGRPLDGVLGRQPYTLQATADGTSEDDPDAAIARAAACIDDVLAQAGPLAEQIGAVAVDTLASSFLALDEADRPLTPMISYADTRNDSDSQELRSQLDEHAVHQRTGCLLRTSYWPARLAWLRRTRPEIWCKAARFVTIGEYLELQLFGSCRAGLSTASWTGLVDRRELIWDRPLLDHLGVDPAQLSPLADTRDAQEGLRGLYAERWAALARRPWFAALGDGAAANIGSGCTGPGRVALTVGTTGALRTVREQIEHVPGGLWCYRVDKKRALLGGATSEGGNVYAWLSQTLQLGDPAAVEQALAGMEPDQHGLTILPLWAGERSPGWAGDARASIVGMTMATTPLEIVRASLEAVAYRFALIADRLFDTEAGTHKTPQAGADTVQIIASGGSLLQSPAWTQIVADVLGRSLICSDEPEATARGAALLGLEALGAISSLEDLPAREGRIIEPNLARHTVYREAIDRQVRIYEKLI